MANQISDIGNYVGYIYVTKPDGTSIVFNLLNTAFGARKARQLGVAAASLAQNKAASGSITVDAVTGVGTITQVLIDGVDQIGLAAGIAYNGATTPTALALNIANAINNFTPGAGANYTALSIGGTCYVFAPSSSGSSVNGDIINVANTGNLTVSTVDIDGGSNSSSVFDESDGYRFFLNSSATATEGDLTGSDEITNFIVQSGVQGATDAQSLTIASGVISPTRKSSVAQLVVDTEGAAASDDLTDITPNDFSDWDTLIIRGADSARAVTVKSSGNIKLKSSNDFDTNDKTYTLTLQYFNGSFYETSRSSQQIGSVTDYRTAGFPFSPDEDYTVNTITAAGGTVTLNPATSTKVQQFLGTATLVANYEISFAGAPKNGDEFWLIYESAITLNGNELRINGVLTYKFTTTQALRGGLMILCRYTSAGWLVGSFYNFSQSVSHIPKIETLFIEDAAVTTAKLADANKLEVITVPVSFETGYTGAQNKIKMPFPGSVVEIYGIATKTIIAGDNATITVKDNGGVTMTGGVITFTAADAQNTAYTSAITANNAFVAGDILTILGEKPTAGGAALVTLKILRS